MQLLDGAHIAYKISFNTQYMSSKLSGHDADSAKLVYSKNVTESHMIFHDM